jgi:hypothetical protein
MRPVSAEICRLYPNVALLGGETTRRMTPARWAALLRADDTIPFQVVLVVSTSFRATQSEQVWRLVSDSSARVRQATRR